MIKLKSKIKKIESLPTEKKEKKNIIPTIIFILITIIIATTGYVIYKELIPYIFATDINKIAGKKINITECNTRDYIIINTDKTYTMSLTNKNCEQKIHEGNIRIKYNKIIFKENITGLIDYNYNILINNNLFESDKNE